MSQTERRDRPIRRWISWVRPDCFPLAASRLTRSPVDPGRSEYSAVTHPLPLPRIHGGTRSSMDAVHSTRVRPIETSTDPGAKTVKSRSNEAGRSSSVPRPSPRAGRAPGRGSLSHSTNSFPIAACSTAPPKVAAASAATAAAAMVGHRWVSTSRRHRPGGLFTGLASTHVAGGPFVIDGVRGLAQHEVEAGAELGQRPVGPGVGRVAEGSAGAVDTHGQGLDTVVRPVEATG